MADTQTATLQCPYCWEQIEVEVDCSIRCQENEEDCSGGSSTIVITTVCSEGKVVNVDGRSEGE